jgi:hypothetical protein
VSEPATPLHYTANGNFVNGQTPFFVCAIESSLPEM